MEWIPIKKKSVNIPNLSLTDEKFESCITDKCYKPHNLVKIYSSICLSQNATVSDIRDFIKAKKEKCYKSTQKKLIFFNIFCLL